MCIKCVVFIYFCSIFFQTDIKLYLFIYLPTYLPIYLSIYLYMYISIYISIYLSIHHGFSPSFVWNMWSYVLCSLWVTLYNFTGDFDFLTTHGLDLMNELSWQTVEQRRDYFQATLMYKCIHGHAPDGLYVMRSKCFFTVMEWTLVIRIL